MTFSVISNNLNENYIHYYMCLYICICVHIYIYIYHCIIYFIYFFAFIKCWQKMWQISFVYWIFIETHISVVWHPKLQIWREKKRVENYIYVNVFKWMYTIKKVIYIVMAKNTGTLGKYDRRRLWKWICIVNPFDLLFLTILKNLTFHCIIRI